MAAVWLCVCFRSTLKGQFACGLLGCGGCALYQANGLKHVTYETHNIEINVQKVGGYSASNNDIRRNTCLFQNLIT